uniref:Carbamoyltransferase n=1 Tax=candidate division WOR-3 bacterium TaxID=2052148 RepID=A0A7C4TDA2_UNCW3
MPRKLVRIRGIVQGVGFRPFVYRLAKDLKLAGFVRNTSYGVEIEIEGKKDRIRKFLTRLSLEKPPASIIEEIIVKNISAKGEGDFLIKESKLARGFTQISPDIATCDDCLKEFFNPQDRRFRFPFINCTNCGPRYSIIYNTPYDRKQTSMKRFKMCPECNNEFEDVYDRRFHAQPDCCFLCGPEFSLYKIDGTKIKTDKPIDEAIRLLKNGNIIAIKGIGGFHIACDATNCEAVRRLRILKNRPTKPFAIMTEERNLGKIVKIKPEEKKIIKSPIAPIMLLEKKRSVVCDEVAPKNPYLGVMLPYAPIHYLLLEKIPYLVMTSGNIADEPLVKDDNEVRIKLKKLVSFYLTHNREVINRCDDSVGFYLKNYGFSIIRRSRGYVPVPVELPCSVQPTLAVGPYLKNTFTLADKNSAYVSPHIGDLDNLETLKFFNEMVAKYKKWFKIEPELIVHDLHPDYLSTKIAYQYFNRKFYNSKWPTVNGKRIIGVQHHIAHIISCLGENRIYDRAIGIAFDGTGYGLDKNIWGSEFFIGDLKGLKRVANLEYLPLPGGEESIKKPYRITIAYLYKLLGPVLGEICKKGILPLNARVQEIYSIQKMIDNNYNLAYTSSMGRLFDCVSAMLGITQEITYEAEAAINLEYIASKDIKEFYSYEVVERGKGNLCHSERSEESNKEMKPDTAPPFISDVNNEPTHFIVCISEILQGIINDLKKGIGKDIISAKFHNTVVQFSLDIAKKLRKIYGVKKIALSGGVFQNRYLLDLMIKRLKENNFEVYTHHKLPTNDGCISYGQVIYGNLINRKLGVMKGCL